MALQPIVGINKKYEYNFVSSLDMPLNWMSNLPLDINNLAESLYSWISSYEYYAIFGMTYGGLIGHSTFMIYMGRSMECLVDTTDEGQPFLRYPVPPYVDLSCGIGLCAFALSSEEQVPMAIEAVANLNCAASPGFWLDGEDPIITLN